MTPKCGFRQKRSTAEQLYCIRRLTDFAEQGNNPLYLIFLDWEKAFDKIDHTKMFISLARLGIPETILNNIKALYKNPTFKVVQGIHESQWCQQRTGIRQGCPLSPYLFIVTTHAMFRILKGHTTIHTIKKHSKGLIFNNFCAQIIRASLKKSQNIFT